MNHPQRRLVRHGDRIIAADVLADGRIQVEGHDAAFSVERAGIDSYLVTDGVHRWRVAVAGPPDARCVSIEGVGAIIEITAEGDGGPRKKKGGHGDATAPMPASVLDILVSPGQPVNAGDVVLKLEAMKMELPVRAPRSGTVHAIHCQIGEMVQAGVVLVDIS